MHLSDGLAISDVEITGAGVAQATFSYNNPSSNIEDYPKYWSGTCVFWSADGVTWTWNTTPTSGRLICDSGAHYDAYSVRTGVAYTSPSQTIYFRLYTVFYWTNWWTYPGDIISYTFNDSDMPEGKTPATNLRAACQGVS